MALPKFLQPYLASYDLAQLDVKEDKRLIITEILNKGDDQALCWLGETYSQREIKQVVSLPIRGLWMKSVLNYWLKIFNLKLNRRALNQATIDLNKF